ncbi:hypothetical protein [Arsukibacterium sp.]
MRTVSTLTSLLNSSLKPLSLAVLMLTPGWLLADTVFTEQNLQRLEAA